MIRNVESVLNDLKAGDTTAFKLIFDTYYDRLFAFSFKYVKDHYAAEEVVENTMMRIWEKRSDLVKIKNLKAYLYTAVRNRSLDYLKKHEKTVRLDNQIHDITFHQLVIEEETHALLFAALEKLPKKCRKIFELCCLEGIPYKDVSHDLQVSVNTVKSQRSRAIQLLKEHLKDTPYYMFLLGLL